MIWRATVDGTHVHHVWCNSYLETVVSRCDARWVPKPFSGVGEIGCLIALVENWNPGMASLP